MAVWSYSTTDHLTDGDATFHQQLQQGPMRLLGSFRHDDWVRSLAEVDGTIFSASKDGEVRCTSTHAKRPGDYVGRSQQQVLGGSYIKAALARPLRQPPDEDPSSTFKTCASWRVTTGETGGPGTQVFGLAVDESGIVAACQDRSIRQWWFSQEGVLTYS